MAGNIAMRLSELVFKGDGNMHVTMENAIVEVQDNEIIVTNLVARSFPIIRYKLGDLIRLAPPEKICSCGREHQIIEEIEGRVGVNIYGYHDKYPSLTLYYIFKNIYFTEGVAINYQCVQKEKGEIELYFIKDYNAQMEKIIFKECRKYFRNDMAIKLNFLTAFRSYKSKYRDFISELEQV